MSSLSSYARRLVLFFLTILSPESVDVHPWPCTAYYYRLDGNCLATQPEAWYKLLLIIRHDFVSLSSSLDAKKNMTVFLPMSCGKPA